MTSTTVDTTTIDMRPRSAWAEYGEWWKRKQADLLRARFVGHFDYAEEAFKWLVRGDEPFKKEDLPRLKDALKLYLKARQAAF